MPRGTPDYKIYGEIAARLGSVVTLDRQGDVVWIDNFEAPVLKWDRAYVFGGEAPVLSSTYVYEGAQSVMLSCGAVINSVSRISRSWGLLRPGKLGVELWVQGETDAPGYLELTLGIFNGTQEATAELRYDSTAQTITIVTATGNFGVATNAMMRLNQNYWLPIKLVVDSQTGLYTRLIVGGQIIDLSAYGLVMGALNASRYIYAIIEQNGIAARITRMYIDSFILTQNEG
uniref:Uncharacterized protein n=1 Tax=viral metagenome TaxID=1070528 RepID=A0A6H2A2X8_9ZZZZ